MMYIYDREDYWLCDKVSISYACLLLVSHSNKMCIKVSIDYVTRFSSILYQGIHQFCVRISTDYVTRCRSIEWQGADWLCEKVSFVDVSRYPLIMWICTAIHDYATGYPLSMWHWIHWLWDKISLGHRTRYPEIMWEGVHQYSGEVHVGHVKKYPSIRFKRLLMCSTSIMWQDIHS
jgi:hypothetical protein